MGNARLLSRVFSRRMLVCALLGFSSGLPFYVLVSLLPAWLHSFGVGLAQIAAFNSLRAPYIWKFLWAPLLDRFQLPLLSRRRDWALCTQLLLVVALAALGWMNPSESPWAVACLAFAVALFSATQDIAVDAYRRELLDDLELGLGNSLAVNLYRLAGVVPGGLALYLADRMGWRSVFAVVATFMLVGLLGTWLAPEVRSVSPPRSLREATIGPFRSLMARGHRRATLALLLFLFLYKLGDNLATSIATPFYLDMGFTLTEIGTLVKLVALWSMVFGSLLGGLIMAKIGIDRALWVFGLVQMLSILGFVALSEIGRNLYALGAAVLFEYLGVGLGTAAFVAFIARATDKRFTGTQFALFSSFIALPGIVVGSAAGLVVEALGYTRFFLLCTLLAVPGMLMLLRVAPWRAARSRSEPDAVTE